MSNRPKTRVFAVCHVINDDQAVRNIGIARKAGANGVFLINHVFPPFDLHDMIVDSEDFRSKPDFLIGANFLGANHFTPCTYFDERLFGLWCDNSGVYEDTNSENGISSHVALNISEKMKLVNPNAEFFGGVAFKGQPQPRDLEKVVRAAAKIVDVVTTSGLKTGAPPGIKKIETIRSFLPDTKRLAIASGLSYENVADFESAGMTDALVSSSVLVHNTEYFDKQELIVFVKALKNR